MIADEEKTIIDSLHRSKHAGGIAEVAKAIRNSLPYLDIENLVQYANGMQNRSLGSRLGYLLESLGIEPVGLEISRGPVNLEPSQSRSGKFIARWKIFANLTSETLFPKGVA